MTSFLGPGIRGRCRLATVVRGAFNLLVTEVEGLRGSDKETFRPFEANIQEVSGQVQVLTGTRTPSWWAPPGPSLTGLGRRQTAQPEVV